eukprot:2667641-Alexandrium_andersonii.AAC.1
MARCCRSGDAPQIPAANHAVSNRLRRYMCARLKRSTRALAAAKQDRRQRSRRPRFDSAAVCCEGPAHGWELGTALRPAWA